MDNTVDIEPQYVIKLAKEYLAGNWLQSSVDTISLKTISGGYCSRLYLCEDLSGECEPSKFLIRFTGGNILQGNSGFKHYNEGTESIVFFMHGHLGYGPKLYGSFKGGRLEEYIPSRTLNDKDLEDSNIRMQIARKLARFHSMKLPVSKKPHPFLKLPLSDYKLYDTPEGRRQFLHRAQLSGVDPSWATMLDIPAEIQWFRETLERVGGRLVLSTSDMNRMNCLIRDVPDEFGDVVTLVDYEIGGTNWRGFDIGTHFVMWMADVNKPNCLSSLAYPHNAIRKEFVEEYLRETKLLNAYDNFDGNGLDSTDHVMMEADLMSMFLVLLLVPFMLKPPADSNPVMADAEQLFKLFTWCTTTVTFYADQKKYFLRKYSSVLNSGTE